MNLSENAITLYESLRNQALKGDACPQELCMIIYHGFLRGLQSLTIQANKPIVDKNIQEVNLKSSSLDTNLIRLLANMVLCSQGEAMHVY